MRACDQDVGRPFIAGNRRQTETALTVFLTVFVL